MAFLYIIFRLCFFFFVCVQAKLATQAYVFIKNAVVNINFDL